MKKEFKKILNLFIIFSLMLLISSCSSKIGDNTSMKETLSFVDQKEFILDSNKRITIGFNKDRVFGNSGVNLYSGIYEFLEKNNNTYILIKSLGATMMAGSPEDMDKEQSYLKSLEGEKSFKIDIKQNKIYIDKNSYTFSKNIGK